MYVYVYEGYAYVSELPFRLVSLVHNIQVSKKLLILSFEYRTKDTGSSVLRPPSFVLRPVYTKEL